MLKITVTAARALARKFGHAMNRGETAQVTPFMNALKAKGTGTMTPAQRREYRGMLDKVVDKQRRRAQAQGTTKAAMYERKKKAPSQKARILRSGRPVSGHPAERAEYEAFIDLRDKNYSLAKLNRLLAKAKTAKEKRVLRAVITDQKKLADAPRRYNWAEEGGLYPRGYPRDD